MKFKHVFLVLLLANLIGCGTYQYSPAEYPLREGLIEALTLTDNVQINNIQDSKEEAIVYSYSGTKLASNYHDITTVMVAQAKKELEKNSTTKNSNGSKSLDLSVDYLISKYKIMHWKSEIRFTVKLGNGKTINSCVFCKIASLVRIGKLFFA